MTKDNSFSAVMARKAEIIRNAVGVDYKQFESGSIAFDYERMMASTGYTLEDVAEHPQNRYMQVDTPTGPVRLMAPGALADGVIPSFGAVPALGEHTASIRQEFSVIRAAQ